MDGAGSEDRRTVRQLQAGYWLTTGKLYVTRERGFTILEVLIAIIILSVTLIPLIGLLPQVLVISSEVDRQTKVSFLARQKVEEVKTKTICNFTYDYSEPTTPFPDPDSTFKYTVTVGTGSDIKDINVSVWYDRNGNDAIDDGEENIELNAKVARRS